MGIIHLDFETYSDINIKKAGAFRYIQSPAFEILLCAYSVDDGPVRVLDLTVPQERDYFNTAFKDLIFRSDSVLMAYNAAFEAGCIARHFGVRFTPAYVAKFRDTMLHGLYAGYTAGLDATGRALGIPEDKQEKIFERFYRLEKSRSKETGGTGLGLAIVKHAVMYHKGSVRVESEEGKGTVFILRIPTA